MTLPKIAHLLLAAAVLAGSAPAAPGAAPAPAQPRWDWPLSPKPKVAQPFDPPDKPWLSGHRGVDLAPESSSTPGKADSQVFAPADGVVTFAGVVVDRKVITIDHGGGLRSSFEPVASELQQGDPVAKGQVIGTIEDIAGHCPAAKCLHWGVRRGDDYVNPLAFVQDLRPSILLPLD
ncbi:M23 family peptidase [Paenarthrobacter ureafaciens]|uniref:M23 family metallopeptidase n=1 Tax=Paenarthrobacter ureafaciens TaxID=37931 RepID=A0AAX3EM32_PAEUR|nr:MULTISPECIES: M23 family metallopeptidase [Paenarthrobacter]NKR12153.1 peptidase M23 [Arthrobacter sp. M5]NKR18111.1 peptidase M23 [Arthrobacter sp. M6]OEH57410.1 peptidase M23 [Arthrobacter sp. D2]OEH65059.1 peptidase M23 [Arthrobacter sp. D4]BCW83637.1 hypothetical protein NicSoilE8_13100 [Arthrobacter sp. NicSoilE8]